ncbi:GTP 3',8-cyclase MoaA [Mediterraneibacter sp. NSJ-55]|uniref:GTP 3',8-cyclase n=1 Tax=Mediterraneibacter hominis TaxID=2763054 RepID=A0A923LK00_9FIRM|nr:GTP 3',8-cyclase MoaA [Mediterraneibacter hominis]MBC5690262.1 GTP 3',8-cyclase MoaA [Mediterraneibacter hominis]
MLKDGYGREITYMRVSVTDRCNLRCVYCMPQEGIAQTAHREILTFDEIVQIVRIGAEEGISRIKITGGEPLVRKGIAALIGMLKAVPGIEQVTMTTNGVLLSHQIEELAKNGLDAVNISLDTLDETEYEKITRCGNLKQVIEGMKRACSCPGLTVKINCVPLMEVKEAQYLKLAQFAYEQGIRVRFIEMMPVGLGKKYKGRSQEEIRKILEKEYGRSRIAERCFGNGPAVYYQFEERNGEIGFISAMSHSFCTSCNRIRLTAAGYLKTCLQYDTGVDLKPLLRTGASKEEVRDAFRKAVSKKPYCHQFTETGKNASAKKEENIERKGMSEIGG